MTLVYFGRGGSRASFGCGGDIIVGGGGCGGDIFGGGCGGEIVVGGGVFVYAAISRLHRIFDHLGLAESTVLGAGSREELLGSF